MNPPSSKKAVHKLTQQFWRNLRRNLQNSIETYGRPTETKDMLYDRFAAARALGFRSGLEVRITKELDATGATYAYEESTIQYEQPAQTRSYTPDLVFPNGIVIELKGLWDSADRKKITMVRQQHPLIDLRMVFSNPNTRISKKSKTSYADVCKKLGISFAGKSIPLSWIAERTNQDSIDALKRASK